MLGWIRYEEIGKARIERRQYGTAAVLSVCVPRGKGLRALFAARRTASLLARQRIRLAAFPADYPYTDTFLRQDIALPDVTRVNLACAPQIALSALRKSGRTAENANIALMSQRVCRELHGAAHTLARTVRYLTLQTPDAEALARILRREYGIAAKALCPNAAVHADLTLSFDAVGENCIMLADEGLEVSYSVPLDGECCTDTPLLAALLSVGALRGRDIRVERLILPVTVNYP